MPDYLAPGVYVEEVPSAIKPIAGVGTSTAAFVGLSADIADTDMPPKPSGGHYTQVAAKTPQPLNNWGEFRQHFGDFRLENQYLAHAVYGFFNNGGTRCWVNRVTAIGDVSSAIEQFASVDEIAIVAAPLPPDAVDATVTQAAVNAIQDKLVSHCQLLENRVAVLDGARDIKNDNLVISIDDSGIWRPAANPKGYGSFFFPWIEVADPLQAAGTHITIPPSGHVSGIYARSDGERGVHKAPANEVVLGALGVRYRVSKILQKTLNPKGVNCIRPFNGTIKVWGARTLASDPAGDPEWVYTNVRRLFNYLRESIDKGTQWVVFEPNDRALWAKITRNITAFLTNVWRAGALFGSTPQEAFFVKCDDETNPPAVRDLGQVVTEIGVAVVKPAEFVIFRISQWAGPQK
jgi:phage tail sheath protein FI